MAAASSSVADPTVPASVAAEQSSEAADVADLVRVSVITVARESAASTAGCGFCSSTVELTSAYERGYSGQGYERRVFCALSLVGWARMST